MQLGQHYGIGITSQQMTGDSLFVWCISRDYTNWTVSTVEELLLNPQNDSRVIDCNNGWVYDQSLHTSAVSDVGITNISLIKNVGKFTFKMAN